ncbi:hypothetical protein TNIN_427891 [Trichonephila inaurata madagascariensis]|uniref:Retroviral polymerase SH3-like domain-containing protein n=1 Tax=Trichonephila inaurata madagascariensis TaxID=2747483 RepID=A0A8X6J762_9ARAC|nr:hypothetical protein TNIN_427891 [Trichonephila inaurata madagascariensis]
MVGYPMKTKGYRIYLPAEKKAIETIDVSFGDRMSYNTNRSEDGKSSGINMDPSFSEPPAKCTRSQNFRKNRKPKILDQSTLPFRSYYNFCNDESSSSK